MLGICINADSDGAVSEISISGSWEGLSELGSFLKRASGTTNLELPVRKNEFYCYPISVLSLRLVSTNGARISVSVDGSTLIFIGDSNAFEKLGDSLINFFDEDTDVDEHFVIDFYEGNEFLNETTIALFFICSE